MARAETVIEPSGVPQWEGTDSAREVRIEEARGREPEFALDRNGFALIKAPTAMADFYDNSCPP